MKTQRILSYIKRTQQGSVYSRIVKSARKAELLILVSDYLEREGLTSRKLRRNSLHHFIRFIGPVRLSDISPETITAFNEFRRKEGASPNTLNTHHKLIAAFFKEQEFYFFDFKSPFRLVKCPRPGRAQNQRIAETDLESISKAIDCLGDPSKRIRLQAIIAILRCSGARGMDIRNMSLSHIDFQAGVVRELTRKAGIVQDLILSDDALKRIKRWLPNRNKQLITKGPFRWDSLPDEIKDQYPLFPSTQGAKLKDRMKPEQFRLSEKGYYNWIKEAGQNAGIDIYPHQFRHTTAHELLDAGADIRAVAQVLGHSDLKITMQYTERASSTLRGIVNSITRKAA